MLNSLRVRLLLILIGTVTIALGTVAILTSRITTVEFMQFLFNDSAREVHVQNVIQQFYQEDAAVQDVNILVRQLEQAQGGRVVVTNDSGVIVADSSQQLNGRKIEEAQPIAARVFWIASANAAGRPVSVFLPGEEITADVFANAQADPIASAFINRVNQSILIAIAAAAFGAVLLTLAFSRGVLGPVEALTAVARRMEKGDLSQRVKVRSNDEIGALAHAFNGMADGLARLEQLRHTMVTDVAHELRTPLTNIRGYLEAVRDGVVEPSPTLIESLHEEALLLNRLVDDLQQLALAEAGQLQLDKQPVDVREITERAVRAMRPPATDRGVTLTADASEELPPVNVDAERIGQVLRNLLANAIAYTPDGGAVTVAVGLSTNDERPTMNDQRPTTTVAPTPRRPDAPTPRRPDALSRLRGLRSKSKIQNPKSKIGSLPPSIIVTVRDTGVGIAPEHLPYLFERFYRADKSRTRETGGAGLGLAIVKHLVEAHGGTIAVESAPGAGSTFVFTLPVEG
jgi:signal transduction histidine kinase